MTVKNREIPGKVNTEQSEVNMELKEYIEKNLPLSIRFQEQDTESLYALPYPYLIPSVKGMFQEMYYWDTYFANTGLILRGDLQQVKNNIEDLLHMIDRFGFVLNGSNTYFLYNSQPPVLALMVREYYDQTQDKTWLAQAYPRLVKEHQFWMERRKNKSGLNRYDCEPLPEAWVEHSSMSAIGRLGFRPEGMTDGDMARANHAAGESGWDFTPRMGWEVFNFAPVDLNSWLYSLEDQLSFFARQLDNAEDAAKWREACEARGRLMRQYLQGEDQVFYDYNERTEERTGIVSAATFYPLYVGMATAEEAAAAVGVLHRVEEPYGVACVEKCDKPGNYQWGHPNGWPPTQRIIVDGLLRYGYREDAMRIADKYVELVERCFKETGHLWEKYNVVKGNAEVVDEYEMPTMLGWTFGVYAHFCKLLGRD